MMYIWTLPRLLILWRIKDSWQNWITVAYEDIYLHGYHHSYLADVKELCLEMESRTGYQ